MPVTPGVYTEGKSAYFDADKREPEDESETVPSNEQDTPGPQWNANTYFPNKEQEDEDARRKEEEAIDPRQSPKGAQTGESLLSRLGRTGEQGAKTDLADVDPRAAHPELSLSGHIISAAFCVPYSLGYSPNVEWVSWCLRNC